MLHLQYCHKSVSGCSPDHFPPHVSPLGRCARHFSVPAAPHVFLLLAAVHLLSPLSLVSRVLSLVSRLISRLASLHFSGRCAQHCSRPLAFSSLPLLSSACSPEHFPIARSSRLAAYLRRRATRVLSVRSFAHSALSFALSLSLSLRSASLCSALLRSRLCSLLASP